MERKRVSLMPIYEYTCGHCGKDFDLLVVSRRSKVACPHCGSRKLTRRLSTFSAHNTSSLPCASGACPTAAATDSPCAAGRCPFSS